VRVVLKIPQSVTSAVVSFVSSNCLLELIFVSCSRAIHTTSVTIKVAL